MRRFELIVLLTTTVLVISALYTPQPITPTLSALFGTSKTVTALLITVSLFFLGVAPVAYGSLLERIPAKRMLIIAVSLIGAFHLALALAPSFSALLAMRIIQGLFFPAALTAAMTHIAGACNPAELQSTMALYIASTITGGFLGRFLSGVMATLIHWRASFVFFGVCLGLAVLALLKISDTPPVKRTRISFRIVSDVIKRPGHARIYLAVFLAFFVFASLLNYLPFRLKSVSQGISDLGVGLSYTGYMMGILAAVMSTRVALAMGGLNRVMVLGLIIMFSSLGLFLVPSAAACFAAMFALCGGMFLYHSAGPGYLNRLSSENRGVVNGLYVSFYYLGGTVGSYLPGFVFEHFGWTVYVLALAPIPLISLTLVRKLPPPLDASGSCPEDFKTTCG